MMNASQLRFERKAGETEVSYFLPSRENGVNDMYMYLQFTAPEMLLQRSRVTLAWSILRQRHPLTASFVEMHSYHDIRFVYRPYLSAESALEHAKANLTYSSKSKEDLIDDFLNGPRLLSNEQLTYLIISPSATPEGRHGLLLCGVHFIADGFSMHSFANELFTLIASKKSEIDLWDILKRDCEAAFQRQMSTGVGIALSLEERLPPPSASTFRRKIEEVDFQYNLRKQIGGQTFPRRVGLPRHTVVPTVAVDTERTRKILRACKINGVSITAALFVLCNYAWSKTTQDGKELPMMLYSAINMRPYLLPSPIESYMFLSIGYFNIVLPTFFPVDASDSTLARKMFWHRSRMVKQQSAKAVKSKMVVSRGRLMAKQRGQQAKFWAKVDDDKANGVQEKSPSTPPTPDHEISKPTPPSTALLGLSLLGNLDSIYLHDAYPDITFHSLQNGVRQRPGGMLMFGYTFAHKLWVSLGYDRNGFDAAVVERFWGWILQGLDELLVE